MPPTVMPSEQEKADVRALVSSGAAKMCIWKLKHTADMPAWPTSMPSGWLYTTKSTRYRDQLSTVIAHNNSTGLYHAHFIRFLFRGGGEDDLGAIQLQDYLDKHPQLTQHRVHMYSGGIVCLSQRTSGGLPSLKDAVLQTARWADGVGDVLRGKPFPHAQA